MASSGQSLRPSQFITTFGPGSILETPDGPGVITDPKFSDLFNEDLHPDDYEIRDVRLSETLLQGNKIFSVPSNADLGLPENKAIYKLAYFPKWSLCTRHGTLYYPTYEPPKGCPKCPPMDSGKTWRKAREEAVRFVTACSHGHLDEVPWGTLIKHKSGCQRSSHYSWSGGGGALKNIVITCPKCGESANFGSAYSYSYDCRGRFPEKDNKDNPCNQKSKIIQRGAANLRVSELRSALTIPPLDTQLHRLLQSRSVLAVLPEEFESKEKFIDDLNRLVTRRLLDPTTAETIRVYPENDIQSAIQDILNEQTKPRDATEVHLRSEEFSSLSNAARYGAPPERSDKPGGPNQFEVYVENVRSIQLSSGRYLRVTPLSRLRVVMVQIGYTRPISTGDEEEPKLVPVEYQSPGEMISWHPGIELFGEGIFLDFTTSPEKGSEGVTEHFSLKGDASECWKRALLSQKGYQKIKSIPGVESEYLNPVFVWWHTLSHRLINALAVDSGYSSSAIRERVYTTTESGKTKGGLLLYTAQSGGDGTLGGLIGLVPHFERILDIALRNISTCSNDPVCLEESFSESRVNGSACYACQLISETSCEHRNTLLDRKLLLENLP